MRVQIKDLKPNPFRDMENYPIIPEKIRSLINSIKETGFWDNILARKNNGKIEIAYGHHRLIVLEKLFKPDDYVDIPIKELDDSTMIRIMANENIESWGIIPKVIYETVRVTKKFLEKHPEIVKGLIKKGAYHGTNINKLTKLLIGNEVISRFLGKNWSTSRVTLALHNLELFDNEEIDKEAVESLPTEQSVSDFIRANESIKTTFEQQKRVTKRIIESRKKDTEENGIYGITAIKSALLDEKYKDKKTIEDEEEKYGIKYRDIVLKTTRDIKILNDDLEEYFILKDRVTNFEKYIKEHEANAFTLSIHRLRDRLDKYIKGGKNNEKNKLYQIND